MKRVFLVEPPQQYNIAGALEFGQVTYVVRKLDYPRTIPVRDGSGNVRTITHERINPLAGQEAVNDIREGLERERFDPMSDYVCLTGFALTTALFLAVTCTTYPGPIRVLMFDSRGGVYQERIVDMSTQKAEL